MPFSVTRISHLVSRTLTPSHNIAQISLLLSYIPCRISLSPVCRFYLTPGENLFFSYFFLFPLDGGRRFTLLPSSTLVLSSNYTRVCIFIAPYILCVGKKRDTVTLLFTSQFAFYFHTFIFFRSFTLSFFPIFLA